MADVMAVADRAVVLRLGRNNGEYDIADITTETLIAAITGATSDAPVRPAPVPEQTTPGRIIPLPTDRPRRRPRARDLDG